MSDASFSSFQDILVPKKSSLLLRLITLVVLAMVCGISFSIVFLKQFNIGHITLLTLFPNVQVSEKPCPRPDLEDWEVPYVHFPKPVTYSREECACHPVRYFAIVSMQRSGSGWFETLLNSHMNVSSNGEIFSKARRANVSIITETLDKLYNLDWMSSSAKNECTSAVGLKWMLNQGLLQYHEDIVKYFSRKGVSIIFLFRRNLLRQMVSKLANIYDHDNKLLNGTHKSHVHSPHEAQILASYKPYMNATTMIRELKLFRNMVAKALNYFNSTRHIMLYYEDVVSNQTKLLDVQDFLRVPRMNLTSRQVKIHKGPLSQQVANWDDVERTLSGTEFESFLHDDYRL